VGLIVHNSILIVNALNVTIFSPKRYFIILLLYLFEYRQLHDDQYYSDDNSK